MSTRTLAERRNDLTRRVILDAALELVSGRDVADVTMRAVAERANIAERTVFRYFATREDFLDALATELHERLSLPPTPRTVAELRAAPRAYYTAFEQNERLVVANLHSLLSSRVREAAIRERASAVRAIVAAHAPRTSPRTRSLVTARICYFLVATTWHYLRVHFRLELADAIACAEDAIEDALAGLLRPRR